jgi:hypothetical protein
LGVGRLWEVGAVREPPLLCFVRRFCTLPEEEERRSGTLLAIRSYV